MSVQRQVVESFQAETADKPVQKMLTHHSDDHEADSERLGLHHCHWYLWRFVAHKQVTTGSHPALEGTRTAV